jgi:hypothetical protein
MKKHITAGEISLNVKTGPVSVTLAPIETCPRDCPFIEKGCYAKYGNMAIHTKRLAPEKKMTKTALAIEEAEAIRGLSGRRELRLHVVGDCATKKAAEIVTEACEEYSDRYGQPVWTYTHAWKRVPREAWGSVSVIASCETMTEVLSAHKRGYACALVGDIAEPEKRLGFTLTPCSQQMDKNIDCLNCRICLDDKKMREQKRVVMFAPHGSCKNAVRNIVRNKVEAQDKALL